MSWFEYASGESAWVGMLAVIIGWAVLTVLAIRVLIAMTASSHSPLRSSARKTDAQGNARATTKLRTGA